MDERLVSNGSAHGFSRKMVDWSYSRSMTGRSRVLHAAGVPCPRTVVCKLGSKTSRIGTCIKTYYTFPRSSTTWILWRRFEPFGQGSESPNGEEQQHIQRYLKNIGSDQNAPRCLQRKCLQKKVVLIGNSSLLGRPAIKLTPRGGDILRAFEPRQKNALD